MTRRSDVAFGADGAPPAIDWSLHPHIARAEVLHERTDDGPECWSVALWLTDDAPRPAPDWHEGPPPPADA